MSWTALCFVAAITLSACGANNTSPQATAVEPDTSAADARQPSDDPSTENDADPSNEADDTDSNTGDDANTSDNNGGPGDGDEIRLHPRFLLYDGDGNAVKAMVGAPTLAIDQYPANQPVGTVIDPSAMPRKCVSIGAIGGTILPVGASFELDTGELAPCSTGFESLVSYIDAQCSGAPHVITSAFSIIKVGQAALWPQGEIVEPARYYQMSDGICQERNYSQKLVPLEPVPASIAEALPNPPYTVKVEY